MLKYFINDLHSDCYIMHEILSTLEIITGSDRQRLCPTKKGNGSMLYGTTWRRFLKYDKEGNKVFRQPHPSGLYYTRAQLMYPELDEIFYEFASLHLSEFKYSHVMINKNYPVDWHFDNKNVGDSVIITFGDYTGGRTQCKNPKTKQIDSLDARHQPIMFNGSQIEHRCEPFEGERYALVFFKN